MPISGTKRINFLEDLKETRTTKKKNKSFIYYSFCNLILTVTTGEIDELRWRG